MRKFLKYSGLVIIFSLLIFGLTGCNSNEPPTASFSPNPSSGNAPLEVTFDGGTSEAPDGVIDRYEWEFGDGNSGLGRVEEHTFSDPGDYTVTLTVTDNHGAEATTTETIVVEESPPSANISAEPQEGEAPLEVSFDISESHDPDGVIEEFELEFGDGESTSGTDLLDIIEHTYEQAGEYTATLEVLDDDQLTDTSSIDISVSDPNGVTDEELDEDQLPTASLAAEPQSGTAPLEVEFSGEESTDPEGEIVSYEWEFGDGRAARGSEVTYRYDRPGTYTVRLRVINDREGIDTAEKTITVNPAIYSVGESASNDFVRITLREATTTKTINDWEAGSGRQYLIVDITVRALEDDQYPSKSLYFEVEEGPRRSQSPSLATSALEDYYRSFVLEEGEVSQGRIAFEVRRAPSTYLLVYDAPNQPPIQFEIEN